VAADGGELATGVAAVGVWWDGDSPAVLLRDARAPGLRLVRTARLVLATGTQALPPVFPRNDLPGVLAARGALVALAEHGFVPGGRAVVLGEGEEAHAVAARLAAAGVAVRAAPSALVAHGRSGVAAVTLAGGERVRCDWVVYAGPRAPAADLARAAGAAAEPDPASGGFRVRAGPDGAAGLPGLLAAGEVGGATSAAQALEAGRRAGERA
jgi:NAD(P)H-nitrite reductase large subunit